MKERVDFYRISQQPGISIEKHAVRVREASRNCGFGEREEEMQRDVFVASVADDRVRSKLADDEKNLSFAEVIEKARTFVETLPKSSPMRPSADAVRSSPRFPSRQDRTGEISKYSGVNMDYFYRSNLVKSDLRILSAIKIIQSTLRIVSLVTRML